MKAKVIRDTEKAALKEKLEEIKKELVKIKAQVAVGTAVKNPGQVKKLRKTLARIITIQSEKKLAKKNKKPEVDKKG